MLRTELKKNWKKAITTNAFCVYGSDLNLQRRRKRKEGSSLTGFKTTERDFPSEKVKGRIFNCLKLTL